VFSGVVLISGVIGSGAYGDDPQLGVAFGLTNAIMYALFLAGVGFATMAPAQLTSRRRPVSTS
jgi:hypothetical protein